MSVEIRLTRHGRRNLPFYRVVAADKRMPRNGRYLELLGQYDTKTDPPTLDLKEERVKYWIGEGAQLSVTMRQLVGKKIPGYFEEIEKTRLGKLQAARKKRKARAKKK